MELSEQEREELMACEFVVVTKLKRRPGQLVDIDFDIGITIIDKNNPDLYLFCSYGNTVEPMPLRIKEMYNETFNMIIEGIRAGVVDLTVMEKTIRAEGFGDNVGHGPSSENCAFNK